MSRRTQRVNELLREELGDILSHRLKDPRVSAMVTVTRVQTSGDLRRATVMVSVYGDDETRSRVMSGLNSAAGFVRHLLSQRVVLKYIPRLEFVLDDSLDRAERVLRILDRISHKEAS